MAQDAVVSPRVTVVIPCFNQGRFVDEAVASVFAQTWRDLEVVIVNDGSTDAFTNEHLASYDTPGVRVLTTTNRGVGAARNTGAHAARGEFLCFLDADDRLAPTFLEKAVAALAADSSLAFASMWLETFGDEQWTWRQDRCDLVTLLRECTVCTAALVRASAHAEVGGFDEQMPEQGYEDWDYWIRLVAGGLPGVILPEVLFHYRRAAGSMSTVCMVGPAHEALMAYLHQKHRGLYEQHLDALLDAQDRDIADALRKNDRLERQLADLDRVDAAAAVPGPAPESRATETADGSRERRPATPEHAGPDASMQVEVAALTARLRHEQERNARVTADLERVTRDVERLKASGSWRITAPLRAVWRVLTGAPKEA